MEKPTLDLMQLAGFGTSLIIDASKRPTLDIMQIAGSIGLKGGHLTLTNCNKKPTLDLMQIIGTYPKNITLNFMETEG